MPRFFSFTICVKALKRPPWEDPVKIEYHFIADYDRNYEWQDIERRMMISWYWDYWGSINNLLIEIGRSLSLLLIHSCASLLFTILFLALPTTEDEIFVMMHVKILVSFLLMIWSLVSIHTLMCSAKKGLFSDNPNSWHKNIIFLF